MNEYTGELYDDAHGVVLHPRDVLAMVGAAGDGDGAARSLLVAGPPRSGKTLFALDALMRGLDVFGDGGAVMAVSGRQAADTLGDRVIRRIGPLSQARPVTTLSAIAFRLLTVVRSRAARPLPKLLNGAEQDALLRQVVAAHVRHVRSGDPCATCGLLREYFAADGWSDAVAGRAGDDESSRRPDHGRDDGRSAIRGINDAFIVQLRDMLTRMNELGASADQEGRILTALGAWSPRTERLHVQWRLAFALRQEYERAITDSYPHEYRLDSSLLLTQGVDAVSEGAAGDLPRMVVVDDVQDLTLAGFSFLTALHDRGVELVLVGNPDEAVQTFRGSYPEYLFDQVRGRLGARVLRIGTGDRRTMTGTSSPTGRDPSAGQDDDERSGDGKVGVATYRDVVASRVSLSIRSPQDGNVPLPDRPGKMPWLPGALPITALGGSDPVLDDGSVDTALYRSDSEELEDVVWRIKRAHLDRRREWNDIAVIAHDNATVRRFGERLRHDGVPVRYSSVTRPLKDEPFVQGLFALLELARLRNRGVAASDPDAAARFVRSRVTMLMGCPLIGIGGGRDHEGRPARLAAVETAMTALGALAEVVGESPVADDAPEHDGQRDDAVHPPVNGSSAETPSALPGLIHAWETMRDALIEERRASTVQVDDTLVRTGAAEGVRGFGIEALYLLLEFGGADVTDAVLAAIQSVCGTDPHAVAFAHLWNLVAKVAGELPGLPSDEPQYALWLAWNSCGVAERWQRESLNNTDAGRASNDRLDTAMRLFDYAAGSASRDDLEGFIEQVRSMRIEADSLAKVAPIDQAVTLTTPAGAAGRHWPLVWMPAMQQGVWPNLAERNTMFGGEDLADVMLHGRLADETGSAGDPRLESVLRAEQKGLLVAITRADERVTLSAVYNDDLTPSDFLYGYLPERFDRAAHGDAATRDYAEVGHGDRFSGLDGTVRGIIAAARVTIASAEPDSAGYGDAVAALRLLTDRGVAAANPENWPFVGVRDGRNDDAARDGGRDGGHRADTHDDAKAAASPVILSPSAVDRIWACPVCWLLENRFAGPQASGVAASFGSLIHAVAQQASEEGLDLPGAFAEQDVDERIAMIASRMMDIYRGLRGEPSESMSASDRYYAARKDATVQDILNRMAGYFVRSNTAEYPMNNVKHFTIGTLESAECERRFSALFSLDDILEAYNAIDGVAPITRTELAAIMGVLVGGWPEGMSEDIAIRLTGRMDRVEHRVMADGSRRIRLIDYKTGSFSNGKMVFNDLQLVCYQLGLAFPENGPRGARALRSMPRIAQSALFHVGKVGTPATPKTGSNVEALFQPPLFADGSLNDTTFTPRRIYTGLSKLFDEPELGECPPGVSEGAWRGFLALRGTQAIWALTMIGRVFYAAAASRSARLIAHPEPTHRDHCRMKTVCPACAGQVDTIFETRRA